MFISEKLIYLALHKTGCSHVLKLLTSIPDLNGEIIGKHNTIYEVSKEDLGNLSEKTKAGNVRNPWNWYVSLWAFGCMKKGGLYEQIINKNALKKLKNPRAFLIPVNEWKKVYSDPENRELFKKWLEMLLCSRRKDIIGFGNSGITNMMGFMTYRYLQLYTYDFEKKIKSIKNYPQLKEFDTQNNFIDFFISNENLENDFRSLMIKLGIQENILDGFLKIPKTNSSLRKHYRDYYDKDMIELVREKDQLIIEKHNYTF